MRKTHRVKPARSSPLTRAQTPLIIMGGGLLVILIAVMLVLVQPSGASQDLSSARIGYPLGNFALADLEGRTTKLSDHQGKVILLNVWATWCPPCRAEMPDLLAFYNAHRDQGFVILAINAGDSRPAAQSFASSYQLTFPVLLDTQVEVIKRLGIFSYPTSVLIDRSGIVRNIQVGMYRPESLAADVTPLLSR